MSDISNNELSEAKAIRDKFADYIYTQYLQKMQNARQVQSAQNAPIAQNSENSPNVRVVQNSQISPLARIVQNAQILQNSPNVQSMQNAQVLQNLPNSPNVQSMQNAQILHNLQSAQNIQNMQNPQNTPNWQLFRNAPRVPNPEKNVYQLKIAMFKNIKPKIWRNVQVPEDFTFHDLNNVILSVFDWSGQHLHDFEMTDPETGKEVTIGADRGMQRFLGGFGDTYLLEKETKIKDFFINNKSKAKYKYDFGSPWFVDVTMMRIVPAKRNTEYPVCIAGRRRSPPEHPRNHSYNDGPLAEIFDRKEIKFRTDFYDLSS